MMFQVMTSYVLTYVLTCGDILTWDPTSSLQVRTQVRTTRVVT